MILDRSKPRTVFLAFSILLTLEAILILAFVYFGFIQVFEENFITEAGDNAISIGRMIPLIDRNTFYGMFSGDQFSADQTNQFRHHVLEHVKDFNVVKVKMFNKNYRVIYSTDITDINRVDKNNAKLKLALEGGVTRRFIKNKHFGDASNTKPFTANVVGTYFPVMSRDSKSIIGAYEIYINVNHHVNLSRDMAWQAFIWVAIILFPMFFLLFLFMHRNMKQIDKAQQSNALLHQQMLNVARHAGQADIATSVLHNIGNIINGSNVSLELLQEHCKAFSHVKLQKLITLFKEHHGTMTECLTQDATGKLIPEYLEQAFIQINKQVNSIQDEITHLTDHFQKIQAIVVAQTSLARFHGLVEKVSLTEVIQTAIMMSAGDDNKKKGITVKTEYHTSPTIVVDKTKLLEILVNLLLNARDAIMTKPQDNNRVISVIVKSIEAENKIQISIADTGCGIADQDRTKIFSYGFTNNTAGKGIGLHISANLAKELGGQLILDESTVGKGSCFSLILPRGLNQSSY